jgi:glyoxylase-like metal-dependent hydrolase (beta-lactamase superfamily II)
MVKRHTRSTRIARQDDPALTRRDFVAGAVAVGAALSGAVPGFVGPAFAAQPVLKTGDFTITSLSDGHLSLPAAFAATNASPDERAAALAKAGQTGDMVSSPLNVTLITTPSEKILVDTGSGSRFVNTAGELAGALDALGVAPDEITKVVYTHAHPDHCWGTLDDFDELTFSSAEHIINEAEYNYWMSPKALSDMPEERKAFAAGAKRQLLAAKDQIKTVKPGADIVTGVRVLDTAGHTPGHISLEVGTGNDRILVVGDALTHPVIAFEHPDWVPGGDQDGTKAAAMRKSLLGKLASEGQRIIGYHLPTPGFGRCVKRGTGFAFEAVKA